VKEKKTTHLNIWFGLGETVEIHPKTTKNNFIHNWCIGGCWVTMALSNVIEISHHI
jgi:hypothetical protein